MGSDKQRYECLAYSDAALRVYNPTTMVCDREELPGKNIVLCLDGTNNEYGRRNSNVVHLFETLDISDPSSQVVYYDPGIGTFSASPVLSRTAGGVMKVLGMAFGLGLTANLREAYRFLMRTYEPGDRIFLFGFSRGAYTARALAGLINMCGLLRSDHENLADYALRIYKGGKFDIAYGAETVELQGFKDAFSQSGCRVHMLGLWDTVGTIGWIFNPKFHPYTHLVYGVHHIRHAVSVDERRAFYRDTPFISREEKEGQSMREVWFAGVHSDVGGGYPRDSNHLSRIPLEWMLVEAEGLCLHFDREKARKATQTTRPLKQPRYTVHRSLRRFWHLAEIVPKKIWSRASNSRKVRVNLWRSRTIPEPAHLHESVMIKQTDDPSYRPQNLPESFETVPWEQLDGEAR